MKSIVIAAHPDDEVLGMGGTIKKLTKSSNDVIIVFMATGIFSRRSPNYENSTIYESNKKNMKVMSKQATKLQSDAKKAAKLMGVDVVEFANFPDNEMDLISNLEITKKIENILHRFKPDTVFTHSPYDINIDHRIVYNATLTATRPTTKTKVKNVISFEVPSSTEWFFPSKFSPNLFIDIHKELPTKIKALKLYKNEIRRYPHPRSVKALEYIAKKCGTVSGFEAAEAFYIVRQLRNNLNGF